MAFKYFLDLEPEDAMIDPSLLALNDFLKPGVLIVIANPPSIIPANLFIYPSQHLPYWPE